MKRFLILLLFLFLFSACSVRNIYSPSGENESAISQSSREKTFSGAGPSASRQNDSFENQENTSSVAESELILTEEEIVNLLYKKLGTEDPDTGYTYGFGIAGTLEIDGKKYYYGRWTWLVTGEGAMAHSSLLCEFFVSLDGKIFRTGFYDVSSGTVTFDNVLYNF